MQTKKFFIKTHGCQMNEYDSEQMQKMIGAMEYNKTENIQEADIVIMNTCHIRDKATERMYSELGRMREIKEEREQRGDKTVIIVAGCVAQAEGEEVFRRAKFVDIVVGPESYHNLPAMINNTLQGKQKMINLKFSPEEKFDYLEQELVKNDNIIKPSAFVTIQEGCNKFCNFCVVPYTRGAEYSRKVEQILEDIYRLVENGTKEIIFLGQNVNAYHGIDSKGRQWSLAQLISKVSEIKAIERIRYTTSHPRDMTPDLIAIHGSEPKLMPLLNLPVQSGSNAILKAMNRKHSREEYIEIIHQLKTINPKIIFSSDFIVGYPGESDEDFEQTLDLIKQVKFSSQCFSFKYSPRPGTPAADKDQIPDKIASERLFILQNLLDNQRTEFNQSMINKKFKVLFDKIEMRYYDQLGGRNEFLQIVVVDNLSELQKNRLYGQICEVEITKVNNNSLTGEIYFI